LQKRGWPGGRGKNQEVKRNFKKGIRTCGNVGGFAGDHTQQKEKGKPLKPQEKTLEGQRLARKLRVFSNGKREKPKAGGG